MIPIFINNRDRLTMTQRLAEQCAALDGVGRVAIVDNDSSYPPLLEWYDRDCPFEIVRLGENRGPRAPWTVDLGDSFYVVTDSDLDLAGVPRDLLALLRDGLEKYPEAIKVGVSLEIEGIPDGYPYKATVLEREALMWRVHDPRDLRFCQADIDTTLAMYRPGSGWGGYGPALRSARPYTARHAPWHVVDETEEDRYYFAHLSAEGIFYSALANEKYRAP